MIAKAKMLSLAGVRPKLELENSDQGMMVAM